MTLATLRQALRQLEVQGLISQKPGRGTFVAEPRASYRLDSLRSFAEDLLAQGQTVSTQILDQSVSRPPDWMVEEFGGEEHAVRLERLRFIAGRPAVHQLSWIRGTDLAEADLSGLSLYEALAELGVAVHRATEWVRPGNLTEEEAALLRKPLDTPVFLSHRITYGLDNLARVYDRAVLLGSVFEIRTERAVTGLSMEWRRARPGDTT